MTASRMTSFVRNYYSLIPKDLPVAWTKLGPGLQARGYDAYANWWSRFDTVTVTPTAADPAQHTVTINLSARNATTRTVAADTELLTPRHDQGRRPSADRRQHGALNTRPAPPPSRQSVAAERCIQRRAPVSLAG